MQKKDINTSTMHASNASSLLLKTTICELLQYTFELDIYVTNYTDKWSSQSEGITVRVKFCLTLQIDTTKLKVMKVGIDDI